MLIGRLAWLAVTTTLVVVAYGCEDESALALLGDGCRIATDCDEGLRCIGARCHAPCATSKDCPGEARCVADEERRLHCQLDPSATCAFDSECPVGLVCAVDGRCRNECRADRDCVSGQRCVSAVCAEPEELEASGRLPVAAGGSGIGAPCSLDSACLTDAEGRQLRCIDGRCDIACFEDRDCRRFERCTTADEPAAPGECVLIGTPGALFCDPAEDPPGGHPCDCPDGQEGTQACLSDGSGYEPCACP